MTVQLNKLFKIILQDAANREEAAGYNGEHSDGGASILRMQIEFYEHGMNGTIPKEWSQYVQEIKKQTDPEYETYKRLKAKFKE